MRGKRRGGPAACGAPAGSRSDKKPRHPHSPLETDWIANLLMGRIVNSPVVCAWRCFLSLTRPGRPYGTAGPPGCIPARQKSFLTISLRRGIATLLVLLTTLVI